MTYVVGTLNLAEGLLAGIAGAALAVGGFYLGFQGSEPSRLKLLPQGWLFARPSGKESLLKLGSGSTVRLIDQASWTAIPRWLGPFPPYVLAHSATTEQIALTKEAFEALRRDLELRGAALIRERPIPLQKGSTIREYRV